MSTIRAGIEESLTAYPAAGLRFAEFPLRQVLEYLDRGHTMADMLELLHSHDLQCIGGFDCVVECFSSADRQARNHARIAENVELLAALGGTVMVVGTDGPQDLGTDYDVRLDAPIGPAFGQPTPAWRAPGPGPVSGRCV